QLPRVPTKESDSRAGNFEKRHGEGQVELDALEALHPGELARLVEEAVAPYIDGEIAHQLEVAGDEAQSAAEGQWEEATSAARSELESIKEEAEEIYAPFREELEEIAARLDAQLTPLDARLAAAWQDAAQRARSFDPTLPERPESELEEPDEDDWLFLS